MKKPEPIHVYFRFYNLTNETIQKFIDELLSIKNPIISKIVKTEITDSNKSMNMLLDEDTNIKEALIFFPEDKDCELFHKVPELPELFQKYCNMSELTKGCEVVQRNPEDIAFQKS